MTRRRTHALRVRQQQYQRTKNPVFVWAAIDHACRTHARIPPWAGAYLARVADNIVQVSKTPHARTPARAVYQALEFGGRRGAAANPFATSRNQWHAINIALAMWHYIYDGHQETYAKELVARAHPTQCTYTSHCTSISEANVLRCWKKYETDIRALAAETFKKSSTI